MPTRKATPKSTTKRKTAPPAADPEAREKQLIALATNLAEKQLQEGTATAQVITHYLKLGSTREKLEQESLREKVKLDTAKTESLQSVKRVEELYTEAMQAFADYRGEQQEDTDDGQDI